MLDASFQEQEYNMKAESPIPTLPPLELQCHAYNSQMHGHQLTACTLSAFISSPPKSPDQTSLDINQSAAQRRLCEAIVQSKATVQSKAVQLQCTKLPVHCDDDVDCVTALQPRPAPRQMHRCTGMDAAAAWDCDTGNICLTLLELLI